MSIHQQIQQQQTYFNNCQQSSEIHYSSNHHQFETNNLPFLNGDYIDVSNNNIMTSSQQPLLFSPSLNPTLNFNANLANINNIPLSNSINGGIKYDNNSLILSISHRMSLIKDYRMKINQCHFEMEQIINYLKNQNQ
ncbi:1312_t:CDS:2 [Entrophospora sp. SA101]|nr:1312_t:CDS:2 [Entrophospora sp. SA101]